MKCAAAESDCASSVYTWNSDDEPPAEGEGEEFACSQDKLVTRRVLQPGVGQDRPGGRDRVLLDWRQDVEWYQLGSDALPCGLECAVRKMRRREVARVSYPSGAYEEFRSPLMSTAAANLAKEKSKSRFLPQLASRLEQVLDASEKEARLFKHKKPEDFHDDDFQTSGEQEGLASTEKRSKSEIEDAELGSLADKKDSGVTEMNEDGSSSEDADLAMQTVAEDVSLLEFVHVETLSDDVHKEVLRVSNRGTKRPREGDSVRLVVYKTGDDNVGVPAAGSTMDCDAGSDASPSRGDVQMMYEGQSRVDDPSAIITTAEKVLFRYPLSTWETGTGGALLNAKELQEALSERGGSELLGENSSNYSYDETVKAVANALFLATKSMRAGEVAQISVRRSENAWTHFCLKLERFTRHETLTWESHDTTKRIAKTEVIPSPREFAANGVEDGGLALIAIAPEPVVDGKKLSSNVERAGRVLRVRSGGAVLPEGLDVACLRTMSLFEDSIFDIGEGAITTASDNGAKVSEFPFGTIPFRTQEQVRTASLKAAAELEGWTDDLVGEMLVKNVENSSATDDRCAGLLLQPLSDLTDAFRSWVTSAAPDNPATIPRFWREALLVEETCPGSTGESPVKMNQSRIKRKKTKLLPFRPPESGRGWTDFSVGKETEFENCFSRRASQAKVYRVWLLGLVPAPDLWALTPLQRLHVAQRHRWVGNHFVGASEPTAAIAKYDEALYTIRVDVGQHLFTASQTSNRGASASSSSSNAQPCSQYSITGKSVYGSAEAVPEVYKTLFVTLQNNVALCLTRNGRFREARERTAHVLRVDPQNKKALLRECQCAQTIGTMDDALENLLRAFPLPSTTPQSTHPDPDIAKALADGKRFMEKEEKREAALFANMFGGSKKGQSGRSKAKNKEEKGA
ncbi:unnamed protein product [Amoebophrya sp. A25]|nr:unnamed protein product [Amoebophrya sp. A25]|eukprot:GSA25T00014151001.1